MFKAAGYVLRRGAAWFRHRALPRRTPRVEPEVLPYPVWINRRLHDRQDEYLALDRPGILSLLTPVFDPPAGFLRILGRSILAQDHRDFQWVLVDNGCTRRDVLYLLEKFARDPRVTLVRAGTPRGIIGGMRLALEHATGEYVCPVDHDDRLYPDALRVVAAGLAARDWPKVAYTDEDKLLPDGQPGLPFYKPAWDPLLFLNCCYVAHLGVLHRQTALELGVYADLRAEGTPDGDAFCRFVAAGHTPAHIPEIVYSWRMHPHSTALLGIEAKPYVTASQKHALGCYLDRANLARKVTVRTNPLHGQPGTWRVCPCPLPPEDVPVVLLPGGTRRHRRMILDRLAACAGVAEVFRPGAGPELTRDLLAHLPGASWVALLDAHCLPLATDFLREFQAVREPVPDAVWIGGLVLAPRGRVHSAGLVWGFDGILGSPLRGSLPENPALGNGGLVFQRSVSAVETSFCLVRTGLLRNALQACRHDLTDPLLPAWLGALAAKQGHRVLFTPHACGRLLAEPPPRRACSEAVHRFLTCHGHLLQADAYYSRYFGLTRSHAYQAVRPAVRRHVVQCLLCGLADSHPSYRAWCGSPDRYPLPPEVSPGSLPQPCPSAA